MNTRGSYMLLDAAELAVEIGEACSVRWLRDVTGWPPDTPTLIDRRLIEQLRDQWCERLDHMIIGDELASR